VLFILLLWKARKVRWNINCALLKWHIPTALLNTNETSNLKYSCKISPLFYFVISFADG
jgi:hypothetical protein